MNLRILVLLVLGLLCLETHAQSLPEVARRERERRGDTPRGPVFTNETVGLAPRSAPATPPADPSPPLAAVPEASQPTPAEVTGRAAARSEQEWRLAFSEARQEVVRAEQRLLLVRQELTDLTQRLLTESSLYNRENILGPEIDAKRKEIADTELRVEAANQSIVELQQELRRAGAPAGWGRP